MPILQPEEGYFLTNGEIYSTMVFLGKGDSPSNWYEIKKEEVPVDELPEEDSLFDIGTILSTSD